MTSQNDPCRGKVGRSRWILRIQQCLKLGHLSWVLSWLQAWSVTAGRYRGYIRDSGSCPGAIELEIESVSVYAFMSILARVGCRVAHQGTSQDLWGRGNHRQGGPSRTRLPKGIDEQNIPAKQGRPSIGYCRAKTRHDWGPAITGWLVIHVHVEL